MRSVVVALVCAVLTAHIAAGYEPMSTISSGQGWSYTDNLYFLMFAYGAYCPFDEIQNWDCHFCKQNGTEAVNITATFYNTTDETFAYAGHDPANQRIILSFRGTVNAPNWLLDFDSAVKEDCVYTDGCEVAVGFTKAYNSLRAQLLPVMESLIAEFPTYEVWVTGHSLGASMATIAAADLAYTLGITPNVNNFGEVRCGNDAYYEWWDQTMNVSWRNTNKKDIVPHAIPRALNFHHVATEIWRNNEDVYIVCDGSGEDPNCSDSNLVDLSVYDHLHYMGIYADCSSNSTTFSWLQKLTPEQKENMLRMSGKKNIIWE